MACGHNKFSASKKQPRRLVVIIITKTTKTKNNNIKSSSSSSSSSISVIIIIHNNNNINIIIIIINYNMTHPSLVSFCLSTRPSAREPVKLLPLSKSHLFVSLERLLSRELGRKPHPSCKQQHRITLFVLCSSSISSPASHCHL
eukprot:757040-Hanusia_phi.AAC.1